MKLYSMFEDVGLSKLELNHKSFCELNNIDYDKFYYCDDHQKFAKVYRILEENPDECIIFVDQYSWFKPKKINMLFPEDLIIVKHDNLLYENFFIVRSKQRTRALFREIMGNKSMITYKVANEKDEALSLMDTFNVKNMLEPYENSYLNISSKVVSNIYDVGLKSSLVYNLSFNHAVDLLIKKHQFANLLCDYKQSTYEKKSDHFEVINPGCPTAFVMLYTKNIENIGIISETNVGRWCLNNNVSLYVYRDVPQNLTNINGKPMSGNWLKPHLLMNHINDHQYVSWIDSDVLITKDYKLTHAEDVEVYADPGNWFFNSGFMSFKNTEKNHKLLKMLIEIFNKLEDTSRIYVNGGDQRYFIIAVKACYPDILVRSNHMTNTHPSSPCFINPDQPALIHFMGYPHHIRVAIMDAYEQMISTS